MSSESYSSLPFDPNKVFGKSKPGRFGLWASGFNSPHNSIHGTGMNGVWQGFGIGRESVSDIASYGMGGKTTLGSLAGPGATRGQMYNTLEKQFRNMPGVDPKKINMARAGLAARLGGAAAWRSLPVAGNIAAVHVGMQEDGVAGGIRGFAVAQAGNYGVDVFINKVALNPSVWRALPVVGAAATAAYAGYRSLDGGAQAIRRRRKMEMGSPVVDPFGNAGTMRQRSLQALTTSQLNGRSAFGSEAQLMHVPVMR